MNEEDRQQRLAIADAVDSYCAGRMSRRALLRLCAKAGIGFSIGLLSRGCRGTSDQPVPDPKALEGSAGPNSAMVPGTDTEKFLRDVGRTFAGTKLFVVSEDTPPSNATASLLDKEFTSLTGIEVNWERLPLVKALARVSSATARKAASTDVYYLDQAWIGRFANDLVDPRTLLAKSDLAYPDYNFDDFIPSLVEGIASHNGELRAIPFDIPIFIMMYRRDILQELGLAVPTTMDEYMNVAKTINEAKAPTVFGSAGQWRSGHYSLECEMTSWLWAHGGSIFGPDKRATIDDEQAEAGMEYMLKLGNYMSPAVTTWDWHQQAGAFRRGEAGIYISWGEFFPSFDDPGASKIVGLAEAAPCPKEIALRTRDACSFGETPGISHQGGSSLAISKYSKNIDAAWVFLQWATSSDVTTRASLLGGGASPMRRSNYADPRIQANAVVQASTTRHFPVTLDAVENRMGTEPHLPAWVGLADVFAVELGKMTTGQQSIKDTLAVMAKAANETAKKES